MISYDQALAAVASHRPEFGSEDVPLAEAVGRNLAEPAIAAHDSPRFDNSAMDGYAVGSTGCGPWKLVGTVAAGSVWGQPLKPTEAVRIYTGAPIPEGAAAVLMQEHAKLGDGDVSPEVPVQAGAHQRLRGEEYPAGSVLLPTGHRVSPPSLSALAATGRSEVRVARVPSVGMLSTGSELRPPGTPLEGGQIYESNSLAIIATLRSLGAVVEHRCTADDPAQTELAFRELAASHDLLLTSGGVSVGGLDLVRDAVKRCGFDQVFKGVAIKPGKPVAFSVRSDGKAWFGLPGNPLSAHVTFCLFVLEYLGAGLEFSPRRVREGFFRKPGREEFMPATIVWDEPAGVAATAPVGSHATHALSVADGLLRIPSDRASVAAGEALPFAAFPWRGGR